MNDKKHLWVWQQVYRYAKPQYKMATRQELEIITSQKPDRLYCFDFDKNKGEWIIDNTGGKHYPTTPPQLTTAIIKHKKRQHRRKHFLSLKTFFENKIKKLIDKIHQS